MKRKNRKIKLKSFSLSKLVRLGCTKKVLTGSVNEVEFDMALDGVYCHYL